MSKAGVIEHPIVPSRSALRPTLSVVNDQAVRDLVDIDEAIGLVRKAMQDLSEGQVMAPERWTMPVGSGGMLALMPGASQHLSRFGIKVLSLFESGHGGLHLPGHQGVMLLFDADDGRPLCIIDANSLTGLRTAAASAVATDVLARSDATTVAMIGTGEQARWHVQALRQIRPIETVRVWGRSIEGAQRFAAFVEASGLRAVICRTARHAVDGSDIVCTVTRSNEPVLHGDWLIPGQHLNLVGSSTALSREVDACAVARSRFVVDSLGHALNQAGELRAAIACGAVPPSHVHAEIGDVLAGKAPGREDRDMITAYKSLGHVAQDLAVATVIHDRAGKSPHTVQASW
jgi:ornithine cyclodeaminase/alanine dehydrogenase-like protein (mu-crystallin family)